jgi:hypothetical protein
MGTEALEKKQCAPRDPQRVPKPKYEATALHDMQASRYVFTICLFISPDLDG